MGRNVTAVPIGESDSVPGTVTPPFVKLTAAAPMLAGSTGSENVTVTWRMGLRVLARSVSMVSPSIRCRGNVIFSDSPVVPPGIHSVSGFPSKAARCFWTRACIPLNELFRSGFAPRNFASEPTVGYSNKRVIDSST